MSKEFQEYVEGLASKMSTATFRDRLLTFALGLSGEAGEVADIIKKHVYHGKELDKDALVKELSDLMWYMAFAANTLEISIEDIIQVNIEKLKA